MKMVKVRDLNIGDVIKVNLWSHLWMRVEPTTARVADVAVFDPNANVLVIAKDGLNEYITDIYAPLDAEYELAD